MANNYSLPPGLDLEAGVGGGSGMMGCPCQAVRNQVARLPFGERLVNMLPKLREEVVQHGFIGKPLTESTHNAMPPVMGGITREQVLLEARSWLRTPFHHGQRCKGAGVDCGQYLLGVFHNAGAIPHVKTPYYPPDFHLHRDVEWYKGLVEQFAKEVSGSPRPGDLVLYHIGRVFSHGGIVVQWPKIIHAYVTSGVSYGHGTQGYFKTRLLGDHEMKFYQPLCFGE